jgi:methylosome protein 50
MDEFLFCIDYNRKNEIITGSNFLTYQLWDGYVTCFNDSDFINDFLVLNPYGKNRQKIERNICVLKWLTDKDILVATDEGSLIIYEYNSECSEFFESFYKCEHDDRINAVSIKTHNETVLTGSQDTYIKLWDIRSELSIRTFRCHRAGVVAIEFNPFDEKVFLSLSQDATALLWDLNKTKSALKLNLAGLEGKRILLISILIVLIDQKVLIPRCLSVICFMVQFE